MAVRVFVPMMVVALSAGMVMVVFMVMRVPADLHLANAESAAAVFAHKFPFS